MSTRAAVYCRQWCKDSITVCITEELLEYVLILDLQIGWFSLEVTLMPLSMWWKIRKLL